MTRLHSRRQRGIALIALLVILALGAVGLLFRQLNAESGGIDAVRKNRNAEVLNRAKQALIGYVAQRAATSGENNPGRLPCPEAVNNIGTSDEGIAAPWIGPPTTTTCMSIGRLPWRTLGLDKLVDTASEPLWYVVGPSWRLSNSTSTLLINSNTPSGDIIVDGQQTVALIVAPGPAMNVQTSAGCTARNQTRSVPSPTMDALDYIECFDPAILPILQFVTTASSTSFNDQVVRITVADIMPAIEAAIANRIEREIAPKLKQVYTAANGWTLPVGTTALFPFAASFTDPESTSDPDTANYPDRSVFKGAAANYLGLAPLARQAPGSVAWINPATGFTLSVLSGGILSATDCSSSTPTVFLCMVTFVVSAGFALEVNASNIGSGFRDAPGIAGNLSVTNGIGTVGNSLQADGSARVRIEVTPSLPAGIVTVQLTINAADSVIDDIATNNFWFFRNGWHRLSLYTVSQGFTPGSVGACGGANPVCLTINDSIYPASGKHAALILAGRALTGQGQTRPNSTLANYLEGENLSPLDETLRRGAASSAINDRVVIVAP